jgi:hypothetical protein
MRSCRADGKIQHGLAAMGGNKKCIKNTGGESLIGSMGDGRYITLYFRGRDGEDGKWMELAQDRVQ